jgi:hypothetical protein
MKYPNLVSLDLIINLIRILHDRKLVNSFFAGLGRHKRKIPEPGDPALDQILDRLCGCRGALIEIAIDAVEIALRLKRVSNPHARSALHTVPLKKSLHVLIANELTAARLGPSLANCGPRFLVKPDWLALLGRYGKQYLGHIILNRVRQFPDFLDRFI